jgi:ATP-dependent Clp protease ATP-binding subunit ClpA/predicted dehydrogenase
MDLQIQPPLPNKRDFRIGILGSGFVVNECHLPAYRKAGFNPVAIASRHRQNAEKTAQRYGIPKVHDSYEDLLNDPSIEVLDIAVPPQAQLELIERACARKTVRGILAQKPLGINYMQAEMAAAACKRAGIVLSVNQNMRYDQSVRAAKTLLQNGVLGEPVFATIEMRGLPHWMPWQAELGWATLRIMSIHHLDCFRYWFGDPEGIYCSVRPDPRTTFPHADGICTYILEYANGLRCAGIDDPWTGPAREGCPADVYLRWRIEGLNGLAIGDIGWCRDPYTTPSTIKYASKGDPGFHEPKWTESWFPDAFTGTMAQLLIALETGTEPAISAADNLKTMALVEAAYASAQRFTSINLEEFAGPRQSVSGGPQKGTDTLRNFTPRAQQALALARREADRLHHSIVGTEHLLLGLMALGQGVSATVLGKLGLDLEKLRAEVERQVGPRQEPKLSGNIPYTPRVKEVLLQANREAENLSHTFVGTEHILLGLLGNPGDVVAQVLKNLGVNAEQTRLEILKELDPKFWKAPEKPVLTESEKSEVDKLVAKVTEEPGVPAQQGKPVNFTPRARQVLVLACKEADHFHHGFVSPEHVLLGIMKLGNGPAFDVLTKHGLDLAKALEEVEKEVGTCPEHKPVGILYYAPRLNKVLAVAGQEARKLGHAYVGTEHLLLALLSEGDGVVQAVLKNLGVDVAKSRSRLLQVLGGMTGNLGETKSEKTGFLGKWISKATSGIVRTAQQEEAINNFTPRAQQVLALARKEADRLHHHFVGTEHLLLGILKLDQGVAVNVLRKMGLELETVRMEVEKVVRNGPDQKMIGNIPYTPRVKKVLVLASKEAKRLKHTYIGTEHILLGLMLEGDGVAARVLKDLDVDIKQTRQEILKELDPNFAGEAAKTVETGSQSVAKETPGVGLAGLEESFTPLVAQAITFALEEARRLKHDFIGPEHILIGLIGVGRGIAFDVLRRLGLGLPEVRGEVEKQAGFGPEQNVFGEIVYHPNSLEVLSQAADEAKALHQSFIGTEHILLGLLKEDQGVVSQTLKNLGVDPAKARTEVLKEIERIFGK